MSCLPTALEDKCESSSVVFIRNILTLWCGQWEKENSKSVEHWLIWVKSRGPVNCIWDILWIYNHFQKKKRYKNVCDTDLWLVSSTNRVSYNFYSINSGILKVYSYEAQDKIIFHSVISFKDNFSMDERLEEKSHGRWMTNIKKTNGENFPLLSSCPKLSLRRPLYHTEMGQLVSVGSVFYWSTSN